MANRQTRALRKQGKSLVFGHGVDFSHMGTLRGRSPEFWPEIELVVMPKQKTGKGNPVDSSKQRQLLGRDAYRAPSMKAHPRSGLDHAGLAKLVT